MRRHIVLTILLPFLCLAGVVDPESCSAATFTWTGTVSSDWFNANNWAPSGVPSSTDTINLTGGAIILTAPVAIGGVLNWSAGNLSGSPLLITSAGVLNINGSVTLLNVLSNAGTVTMTGPFLTMYNNDTIYLGGVYNLAGALWDIQTNANLLCGCSGHEFFNNAGTFQKSQGSGTTSIQMSFYNTGTVSSLMGGLLCPGGGTFPGSNDAESGATINFLSGSYSMDAPPGITGSGLCEFSGGTLTLNQTIAPNLRLAGGNVVLGPAFQDNGAITNLALSGSTLVSTNTVTGTLTGTSGTLAGPLSIASGGVLNINGSVTLENVLSNAGTVTMTGPAALTVYNNNVIYLGGVYNLAGALWDIQTNANLLCACYGHEFFNNAGTLQKSQGSGTTTIQMSLYNTGTVSNLMGGATLHRGRDLIGQL